MAATSTTETWDAAWTLTMRSKRKRLTDNIFDEYPLLKMLSGNAEVESGGKEIQEDLLYGKNSATWFDGYDTVNTDAVDGITMGYAPWRYTATPITISMTERDEGRQSDAAKKILEAKTQQSMLTARDAVNAAFFSAQSGKSTLGLQDLIADSPSTGTVMGINRANESWWRNQADTTSSDVDSISSNINVGTQRLGAVWNNCSEGNDTPSHIFTTLTVFGDMQNLFEGTGYARLAAGETGKADAGSPVFRGATIQYDRDCPSQHAYLINSKYLKLKIQQGKNFAKTSFKEPVNQFAMVAYIVFGCQLIINNARRHGVATTLT